MKSNKWEKLVTGVLFVFGATNSAQAMSRVPIDLSCQKNSFAHSVKIEAGWVSEIQIHHIAIEVDGRSVAKASWARSTEAGEEFRFSSLIGTSGGENRPTPNVLANGTGNLGCVGSLSFPKGFTSKESFRGSLELVCDSGFKYSEELSCTNAYTDRDGSQLGVEFTDEVWKLASPGQKKLLSDLFQSSNEAELLEFLSYQHADQMAEFFVLTHAWEKMNLWIDGAWQSGLNLIKAIVDAKTDRMIMKANREILDRWQDQKNGGGRFFLSRADNPKRTEKGRAFFNNGGFIAGGSVHKGFVQQLATSAKNSPRLQINWNPEENLMDMDIDGYKARVGGILPNPRHLTFKNSDVRAWYNSYCKKFGDVGLRIIKN